MVYQLLIRGSFEISFNYTKFSHNFAHKMSKIILTKNKIQLNQDLKISPFRKEIRNTSPHKHDNYFEIVYLSEGSGVHSIDSQEYTVKPPVIFLIRKEQIHHWALTAEPNGYVLIIKKSFIDNCLDRELQNLLAKLSYHTSLELADETSINQLFELLCKEKTDAEQGQLIHEGLLKALLAKILTASKPLNSKRNIPLNLYQSFQELLRGDLPLRNNVTFYAKQLNTSSQNLNIICRKANDQSAAEVLAEFIIKEAKRLLIYTDNTISEIAFELNFSDSSHFVKYFKRFTNTTPKVFRESQN